MTNFEKYKDKILELSNKKFIVAFDKEEKQVCHKVNCADCAFFKLDMPCVVNFTLWLCEEYQEPPVDWSTVAIDTPILVSNSTEKWHKRYFCKYEDGKVFTWLNGSTSWTADDIPAITTKRYTSWDYAKLAEEDAE